ncbi:MAG: chloride channel protein, partial [Desulfovibrionaceae bacterium]|nr:chloride channel protein [Desulfovibrionaceae bacterium]
MPAYKKILPPSLFELHELRDAGLGRLVCEAVTTGLVTGLVIGFSRIAYTFINQDLSARFLASALSPAKVLLAAAFIALCACVAYFCSRKEPLAGGSGIPQVELALRGMLPMPWLRVLCCKFVGTLATMCGCLSLGRAAPSVQMGSAIGCGVGRLWHEDGMRPRFLVGGAAAGLTACFGAPWAGIAFAFEELRTFAAPAQLLFMGLAASSAWFMTDVVLGLGLVFPLPLAEFSMREIWLLPVLGLVCGVLCWLYNASIARLTMLADRFVSLRTRFFLSFGLGFGVVFIY